MDVGPLDVVGLAGCPDLRDGLAHVLQALSAGDDEASVGRLQVDAGLAYVDDDGQHNVRTGALGVAYAGKLRVHAVHHARDDPGATGDLHGVSVAAVALLAIDLNAARDRAQAVNHDHVEDALADDRAEAVGGVLNGVGGRDPHAVLARVVVVELYPVELLQPLRGYASLDVHDARKRLRVERQETAYGAVDERRLASRVLAHHHVLVPSHPPSAQRRIERVRAGRYYADRVVYLLGRHEERAGSLVLQKVVQTFLPVQSHHIASLSLCGTTGMKCSST